MPTSAILCNSPRITTVQLSQYLRGHDVEEIVDFIRGRFTERYVAPIRNVEPSKLSGFLVMAVSCLTLEVLHAFQRGWRSSERHTRTAFETFLSEQPRFTALRGFELAFYENVRCGITHRGETCSGWRIWKVGPLFQADRLIVNAIAFHCELEATLLDYCAELRKSDFRSPIWKRARKTLSNLIENCEVTAQK